jgi:hypothetical protein
MFTELDVVVSLGRPEKKLREERNKEQGHGDENRWGAE